MTAERCTHEIHAKDSRMKKYDETYYRNLIDHITGEVLDLGCGAGLFIERYSEKDEVTSVLGLDKHLDDVNHDIPKVRYEKFDLPDELGASPDSWKFNTIVATEFIEHIPREKLEPLLEKVKALLTPTGKFVGSTPNKKVPTTNEFHLYEYNLTELTSIFRNYFTDVETWDNGQNCINWVCKL